MAEPITIARPFAEALFRTALEGNDLGGYSNALGKVAAIARDAQAGDVLANPRFSLDTKMKLLGDVAGQMPQPLVNLLGMLVESRRAALLPPISEHFETLKYEHESVLRAHIESAFPLSDAERDDLVAALAKKHGRKVEATVSVDPSLLGGVRIHVGDEVTSASVRDQLNQMALALSA